MKKELTILLVAVCFVALMAVVVMAENNTDENNTNLISSHNASNMTFGKCVADSAKIRQGCYAEDKNASKSCVDMAKSGKDKNASKQCLSDYKLNKKDCKGNFKEAKISCMQTYKPGFWERMRHAFD